MDEIVLFPITGWDVGPLPRCGLFMFRPHYVTNPLQPVEQALMGPNYALTAVQCRELAQKMLAAIPLLESAEQSSAGHPQH